MRIILKREERKKREICSRVLQNEQSIFEIKFLERTDYRESLREDSEEDKA